MKIAEWWDSICTGCGQCCCEKYPVTFTSGIKRRMPGNLSVNKKYFIDYSRPCSWLDLETGRCLVFEQRHELCSSCIPLTVLHAVFADYLPADCAYVKMMRPWIKFIPRKHKKD